MSGKDYPMKKFLMSAAAVCALLLTAPAMAQPDHNGRGDDHRGGPPAAQGQSHQGHESRPAPTARPQPAARPEPSRPAENARPAISRPDNNRHDNNRHDNNNRPNFNRPDNNNNRPGVNRPDNNNRPNFNRPDHNNRPAVRPHPRPDYSKYRRAVTAPRRFHVGTYRAPHGYSYRRWSYGQYLPSVYWGNSFWLSNFVTYGLFAPPPDAVWVRYGPDALLVDRYTGEVISVEYNVFY